MNNDDKLKSIISNGAELAGSAAGGALGFLAAGLIGAAGGAVSGPLLGRVLKKISSTIYDRLFEEREKVRIGAATIFAIEKIQKFYEQGFEVRQDGFFNKNDTNRSAAEEILEGVFLKCKASYDEKKVKYYGYFFANVAFDSKFSVQEANFFLNMYERLTYRQLYLMRIFYSPKKYPLKRDELETKEISSEMGVLLQEINELIQLGLVKMVTSDGNEVSFLTNIQHINLPRVRVTTQGISFIEHFDLEKIPEEDFVETLMLLK